MSVYEKIQEKLKQKLSKQLSEEDLKLFLSTILHDQSPKEAFHQVSLQSLKEPTLLFTRLMVQDIRQNCYTYPFIIQKPFTQQSKTYFFKYGHKQTQFQHSLLQDPNYFSFLQDQETVSCMAVVGETEWVRGIEKNQLKPNQTFEMVVDKLNLFKLGEIFSAVCLYEPEDKQLNFVRKANEDEIKCWSNLEEYLSQQLDLEQIREKFLNFFQKFYSQKYSHFLLYTILSTEHLFISAFENHSLLFKKLLPRVCEVKIQAPFKQSFFPYKNQEDILVNAPMQMSDSHTFVILDFSKFSSQKEVKIGPEEIDNLKALKVFVEEGSTIYRWAYGESLVQHKNTGIIVKASSIISPQYVIAEKSSEETEKQVPQIQEADLRKFRSYIQQVRKINPIIKEDLKEIETRVHSETIKFNEISLVKIMELSKLNARSHGRQEIKTSDFLHSCSLYF